MATHTKSRRKKQGRRRGPRATAKNSDKYDLYQKSVNSPDNDVEFLIETYTTMRGRAPQHLREDFCGTAALAAEWIRQGDDKTVEGFDIDPEPVEWGKKHNFASLGDAADRMTWQLKDVRDPSTKAPDVRTAPNFSYWIFTTRKDMLEYFTKCREDLAEGGLYVVDLYGGPEALCEMQEERDIGGGVTYVWDQKEWWPGSGEYEAAIHFHFHDGSKMEHAFEYSWRMWGLTELKDIMLDAGFATVDSYFEGTDEDDESGDGNFEIDPRGENCEAWIAYLVAAK